MNTELNPPPFPAANSGEPRVINTWTIEPIEGPVTFISAVESLLKTPGRILHECASGSSKAPRLLVVASILCLAVFGLLIGSFSGGDQYWAAPAKIVGGTLLSMLICLPSLYIFGALDGIDARLSHIVGLMIAAVSLTALLLLGFAPVIWVFSQSSDGLLFMGILALTFWIISLVFGMRLLLAAATSLRAQSFGYLKTWITIFLVVTLQMSTALRPIIGTASTHLPTEKRFFLSHWMEQIKASDAEVKR